MRTRSARLRPQRASWGSSATWRLLGALLLALSESGCCSAPTTLAPAPPLPAGRPEDRQPELVQRSAQWIYLPEGTLVTLPDELPQRADAGFALVAVEDHEVLLADWRRWRAWAAALEAAGRWAAAGEVGE